MIGSEYGEISDPVPHAAYEDFTDAIVAPMRWSGDVRGVLGAGRKDGEPFGPRDASVLDAFAGLASLALRNAETSAQDAAVEHAYSAASTASRRCSASRSRETRRWKPSRRRRPRRSAALPRQS